MADKLKLPPGAVLVDDSPAPASKGVKLPPGAELVQDTPQDSQPSAADLTANTKGEGLYRMIPDSQVGYTDTSQEIRVPFSRVNEAKTSGYRLHEDETKRFDKDFAHQGQGPTLWERINSHIETALQPEAQRKDKPARSDINNTLRAAGRALYGTPGYIKQVAAAYKDSLETGNANELLDLIDPTEMPANLVKQYQQDSKTDKRLAVQNLVGSIIGAGAMAEISHGVSKAVPAISDAISSREPKPGPVRSTSKAVNEFIKTTEEENKSAEGRELAYRQELRTKADEIRIADQTEAARLHEETRKAAEKVRKANEDARAAATEANRKAALDHLEATRKAFHETEGREIEHRRAVAKKAEEIRLADATEAAKLRAEHEKKVGSVQEKNKAVQTAAEQKEAAESLWKSKEPQVKKELKATEDKVNEEANKKYNDIRAKIGGEEVPDYQRTNEDGFPIGKPVGYLQHIYDNAIAKITDWTNDPTLLKKLGERVEGKGVGTPGNSIPTYAELQELRTKVGSALRGNLPSDQFYAYKGMMEDIDEGMQKVADANGEGEAQAAARAYYKNYAEAFLDNTSPIYKAIHAGIEAKTGDLFRGFKGREAALEALVRYNPDLAGKIKVLTDTQDVAAKTKIGPTVPEPASPKPLLTSGSPEERAAQQVPPPERVSPPEVPPEVIAKETPEPTPPPLRLTSGSPEERAAEQVKQPEGPAPGRKVNVKDIEAVKREAYLRGVDTWVRNRGQYLALWPAFGLMRTILHGSGFPIGEAALESGGTIFATRIVAKALENPKIANFFTKATARDVAAVPQDLRGDLPIFVKAARANGVKVSPALIAFTVAATRPKKPEVAQ